MVSQTISSGISLYYILQLWVIVGIYFAGHINYQNSMDMNGFDSSSVGTICTIIISSPYMRSIYLETCLLQR